MGGLAEGTDRLHQGVRNRGKALDEACRAARATAAYWIPLRRPLAPHRRRPGRGGRCGMAAGAARAGGTGTTRSGPAHARGGTGCPGPALRLGAALVAAGATAGVRSGSAGGPEPVEHCTQCRGGRRPGAVRSPLAGTAGSAGVVALRRALVVAGWLERRDQSHPFGCLRRLLHRLQHPALPAGRLSGKACVMHADGGSTPTAERTVDQVPRRVPR